MEINYYQKSEISKVAKQVAEFYSQEGFSYQIENIDGMVLGSQSIATAIIDGKLVGVGRTVGDEVRFTYIVDLIVNKDHRGQGIGTKLVRILAKSANTYWVELTTDPNDPRLPEFYQKAGFELSKGEHVFEWPKG